MTEQTATIDIALIHQMLGARDVEIMLLRQRVAELERRLAEIDHRAAPASEA